MTERKERWRKGGNEEMGCTLREDEKEKKKVEWRNKRESQRDGRGTISGGGENNRKLKKEKSKIKNKKGKRKKTGAVLNIILFFIILFLLFYFIYFQLNN